MKSFNEVTEKIKKEQEYKNYIDEHIKNVISVIHSVTLPVEYNYFDDQEIKSKIRNHDLSKYSTDEFDGYRQWFYPTSNETKNKTEFDKAWKHHYENNSHHWEYWIDENGNPKEMDIYSIIEMMCDWSAMSIKFKNKLTNWYKDNKNKMKINKKSLEIIECYLPYFETTIEILQ